jgi:hypothetical protein
MSFCRDVEFDDQWCVTMFAGQRNLVEGKELVVYQGAWWL